MGDHAADPEIGGICADDPDRNDPRSGLASAVFLWGDLSATIDLAGDD